MQLRKALARWQPLAAFSAAVLFFCASPLFAAPQMGGFTGIGNIMVNVKDTYGASLTDMVDVRLYTEEWLPTAIQAHRRAEGFEFDHVPSGRYFVQASVAGYHKGSEAVVLDEFRPSANVFLFLKREGLSANFPGSSDSATVTPKVQKETEKALSDLRANKFESARKHLTAALKTTPASSNLNYLLGMTYVWSSSLPEGKPYLEKAVSLDPKYVPSRLALGYVLSQQADFAGAIGVLEPAAQAPSATWQVHWLLAGAYLHERKYQEARALAERAIQLGGEKAAGAQVLLGQALAALGEREEATTALTTYLKSHPEDAGAERLRRRIAAAPQPTNGSSASAVGAVVPPSEPTVEIPAAPPPLLPDGSAWAPPDVDATAPAVAAGASCSLPGVLQGAGKRAQELVADLQKFSATEQYQSVERRPDGTLKSPNSAEFTYLVDFHVVKPGLLQMLETRAQNGKEAELPDTIQDLGSPAIALLFHPDYQSDFEMKCEGLSQWKGHAAWVVRFDQRTDRPNRISSFHLGDAFYPVHWKGRAWIAADEQQVLHLETDLLRPLAPIRLRRQHMAIDYQPVAFPKQEVELWLPQEVDVYLDFRGRSYHHYHRYTNYKLFWVGATQKISEPPQKQPQP